MDNTIRNLARRFDVDGVAIPVYNPERTRNEAVALDSLLPVPPSGWTGTFEADADTVTVVDGIITDVSPAR